MRQESKSKTYKGQAISKQNKPGKIQNLKIQKPKQDLKPEYQTRILRLGKLRQNSTEDLLRNETLCGVHIYIVCVNVIVNKCT